MSHDRYGLSRVIGEKGVLPQRARRLEPALPCREAELLIDVESLNIDAASFKQIKDEVGAEPARIAARVQEIVRERGKMQNPVTGSGGMLLGRVTWIGAAAAPAAARWGVAVGDRVASLVSLTLTPLHLERIVEVRLDTHQVDVEGHAVIFSTGTLARMPDDLPERVALALFDIAGAGPQVERLASPGSQVLILGCGGKSGLVTSVAARRKGARVIGLEAYPPAAVAARALGACEVVVEADASDALATAAAALAHAPGGYDLVVSCVNGEGAELGAILSTRLQPRGRVYFFSMSTSFSRAALGAEGVARDIDMLIGNGYCDGHAEATLALVRSEPKLLEELRRRL